MGPSPSLNFGLSSFVILATPNTSAICRYCFMPGLSSEALHPTCIGETEPKNLARANYYDPALQRAHMRHRIPISKSQGTRDHTAYTPQELYH